MARLDAKLVNRDEAFQLYFDMGQGRSLQDLNYKLNDLYPDNPEKVPEIHTLKHWSVKGEWQLRIMMLDKDIRDGVNEVMVDDWVKIKAKLLKTLLDQIDNAIDDGIRPVNARELVGIIHEVRGIMGEGDTTNIVVPRIEYVPYKKRDVNSDSKD